MKKARFETLINCTSVFTEGSYAESDWNEGSKIKFLSPGGNGLYSEIEKKVTNEYMSFRHISNILNGEIQPQNEETAKWTGATENYTLHSKGNNTQLIIEMDVADDSEKYFLEAFPKAISRIKEIAESDVV